MMKRNYPGLLLLILVIGAIACSKGGDTGTGGGGGGTGGGGGIHGYVPDDTTAPGVTIYTPSDNQSFVSGNTISVTGKVTDDFGLYRGTIKVVNDATGFALINQPYDIHGITSYNFSIGASTTVTSATNYTVTVSFEDHGYNTTTKSVKIKMNP